MNALIKELFKHAANKDFPNGVSSVHPNELERFAELIVKECARVSIESDDTMTNQGAASAEAFMNHFGIN